MKEIFERRSIRKYQQKPVTDELLEQLVRAGMAAPTAGNQQEWEFIIIDDRVTLDAITEVHPYSSMLKQASAAIIVCADIDKEIHEGYWVQDCAAATQNILLLACHLGLGTCWLGVYPRQPRVEGIKRILGLPKNIMPLSAISIGYPAEKKPPSDRFDINKIHKNKWQG